jgi:lysophospholipase L1-like esterase
MKGYAAPPDIALIHLGTNDQNEPDLDRAVIQPLREIVAMLRRSNPRVAVLLGHLNFNGGAALKLRPLVDALARDLDTPGSPVRTVAMYEGWIEKPDEPGSDTFDWAHPNEQGQRKMAAKWLAAMKPLLTGGDR